MKVKRATEVCSEVQTFGVMKALRVYIMQKYRSGIS